MGKVGGSEHEPSGRYAVLNHMPVGVCVLRGDYTVAYWNACLSAWTGVYADAVLDQVITDVFPNFNDPGCRTRIDTVLRGGPPVVFPPELYPHFFSAPGSAASERVQQATVTAVPADGLPGAASPGNHVMIVFEDVLDRSRWAREYGDMHNLVREESARRKVVEEEKSRIAEQVRHLHHLESLEILASGIAHDINNLLSVIIGNADIIATEAKGKQLLSHCNGEVQKAALGASDLVAQMLAYSGGGTVVVDVINLTSLVENIKSLLISMVPKRVNLVFALMPDLPDVAGNGSQLQQAVVNLLANAADAIGDDTGTIRMATGVVAASAQYLESLYQSDSPEPGDYVYLEVKDSGPGLDEAMLDKILDLSSRTKSVGRGLGLPAMQKIVRAHRGGVRVLSIPGEGTAFRIHFPMMPSEEEVYPEESRDRGLLDDTPMATQILLVDDEEMVRALGQIILEQHGYAVVTAADGEEAIRAYQAHADTLALVLLDMSMPKRSGYEVAKAMRAIRADTPIILCSGYAGVDAHNRYPDLRVDGFLRKPYRKSELIQTVQRMLARFDL